MIDQVREDAVNSAKIFIEDPDVSKLGACMLSLDQYCKCVKYTLESFSPTNRSGFALSVKSIRVGDVVNPIIFVSIDGLEYPIHGEVRSIESFTDTMEGNQYLFYRIVTSGGTIILDSTRTLEVTEISHTSRDHLTLIEVLLESFCNHPFGELAKHIVEEIKTYFKDMEGV